jgi:zinc protease
MNRKTRWVIGLLPAFLVVAAIAGQQPQSVPVVKPATTPAAGGVSVPPISKRATPPVPRIIALGLPSAQYAIKIMIMAGSADDPAGKEGVASLTAHALIEAGFGDPKNPVGPTKLAALTRSWGSQAIPTVAVDKQTTTFSMVVPEEGLSRFVAIVLKPMFSRPLFEPGQIERLRLEALAAIQHDRREQELLGRDALESYVFEGTPLAPPSEGTVHGLHALQRADLIKFYRTFYTDRDAAIATSASPQAAETLRSVLPGGQRPPKQMCGCDIAFPAGREVLIVTQPNAPATRIYFGFPIEAKRNHRDYWPLFLANLYFGAPEAGVGQLSKEIGAARGYSVAFSEIEYPALPGSWFGPSGMPRSEQYFSLWTGPVDDKYAHFILKAVTGEFEHLVMEGLTAEQVEHAKALARALYAKYAADAERQLAYGLDDAFYGLGEHAFLPGMLKNIDTVTVDQVNAAIHRHLQSGYLRYVIVTSESFAGTLAENIADNSGCASKLPGEYPFPSAAPELRQILDQDEKWIAYPLNIRRADIHIVSSGQLFETATLPGIGTTAGGGAGK